MDEIISLDIPKNIENLQLPSPELLEYYKDIDKRIFWLDGEVDSSALEIVKAIMRINHYDEKLNIPKEERVPIKLFIDTNGGDVQVMWTLINAIGISKTPVYTIVYCLALSAGAHILAAGHKKFAFPGSTILVHSGSVGYQGIVEQVESAKKYYDSVSKQINDKLLTDTLISQKELKRKGAVDWYMSAEDALKYKLIDRIIEDFAEVM